MQRFKTNSHTLVDDLNIELNQKRLQIQGEILVLVGWPTMMEEEKQKRYYKKRNADHHTSTDSRACEVIENEVLTKCRVIEHDNFSI